MVRKTAFEGSVEYIQIIEENGHVDKKIEPKLNEQQLKKIYEDMVLCRIFDKKAVSLQRQGRMYTYAPLEGQEACQVGSMMALSKEDWVFPTYRDHGAFLARAAPIDRVLLYWMGYDEGMIMPEGTNIFPTSITVGNHLPMAAGMAWGMRLKNEKTAVLAYLGDGASSQGDFHEALNFASVYKAPCIFLCQNNQWAISVPVKKQMACQTIAQRALGYGAWGIQVDGNDVLAVFAATKKALEQAYSGGGPSLIECLTYRMNMHTTADDPKKYRDEKETERWRKRDPIDRFQKYMASKKIWNSSYEAKVQERAKKAVEEAVKKAENYRMQPDTFFDYVFEQKPWHLQEQKESFLKGE